MPRERDTSVQPDTNGCYSNALARSILAGLPSGQIKALLNDLSAERSDSTSQGDDDGDALLELCRSSPAVFQTIKQSWRQANAEVVFAAKLVPLDGPCEQCRAIVGQFGAEAVLLELLTDDRSGGWDVVEWVVDNIKNEDVRRECVALLGAWSRQDESAKSPEYADGQKPIRVSIFGGHPRDASKMNRRLFDDSPFAVSWHVYDKTHGDPDDREIAAAVAGSHAVILVTTRLSHNVMYGVKRFTQRQQIAMLTVKQATDRQLRAALAKLYPQLALTNQAEMDQGKRAGASPESGTT